MIFPCPQTIPNVEVISKYINYCYGLNYVLKKDMLKSYWLRLVSMILFGNRVIADIKMQSLGWALIQYGRCPYKKKEIWTQTHGENTMGRQK